MNGGIVMILTKKELKEYLQSMRISIPAEYEKELLAQFGSLATDDEGHVFEYTEQDIYEQLRKKLRLFEKRCANLRGLRGTGQCKAINSV
jgi:hypothetical protein